MEFRGEIAEIQQRLAASAEMAARRQAVLETLTPRRGERVLEVGCGAGLLLREIGLAVAPHGLATGIDLSPDQIAAAEAECTGVPATQAQIGDATALPYPAAVFDAVAAVQVVEYIADAPTALAEIRRVLKPGGRFLCLATNWDSAFWHGAEEAETRALLALWSRHAAWPNLPARIGPMLARAGFGPARQIPVPIVNPRFEPGAFAFWIARLMAAFAEGEGMAPERPRAWISALTEAEARGEFFFSSVPILTTARAI